MYWNNPLRRNVMDNLRESILRSDPRLGKFDPLSRIIFYDDFDEGYHGWSELIGNYEDDLASLLPGYEDLRPPLNSSQTSSKGATTTSRRSSTTRAIWALSEPLAKMRS